MRLEYVTLLVPDYEAGLAFLLDGLGFTLVENSPLSETTHWVVVRPPSGGSCILLARATNPAQAARVGDQTGGRVAYFFHTDDFARDRARIETAGGRFLEAPRREACGTVSKVAEPFGNVWDLVEPARAE